MITRDFYMSVLLGTLEENGYEVRTENKYVFAEAKTSNLSDLLICLTARCLSNVTKKETTMISFSDDAVDKLLEKANTLAGDYTPALAFGIGKYTLLDSEIIVAPLKCWDEGKDSRAFFKKKQKWFYDFCRMENEEKNGSLIRSFWTCHNL